MAALLVLFCNLLVFFSTKDQVYFDIDQLPSVDVGLVLGTSKKRSNGESNQFFQNRMEAAEQLFSAGKVKYLILSGNNDSRFYNEPRDMQQTLLAMGVPNEALILDYKGYRTYDSMYRAKYLFNAKSMVVVSQSFHNYRALFIARHLEMDVFAFSAVDVPLAYSLNTLVREYFARALMMIDLYVFKPKVAQTNKSF